MPNFVESTKNKAYIAYGCIFCKTGSEKTVARALNTNVDVQAIAPERKYRRRVNGKMKEQTEILFPGYVFFRAPIDFDSIKLLRYTDVYKLLTTEKEWMLRNADADFAQWLFKQGEVLEFSNAYFEGDRIRIASGPLKDYEGQITRVNKRFQNAQIVLNFHSLQIKVWLGYEQMKLPL